MAKLTVMTWNVQNLFAPGLVRFAVDRVGYEAKLAQLAAVIDRAAPDVLAGGRVDAGVG